MTYIQSKKVSVGLRAADSHSYILKSKCANVNKTHTVLSSVSGLFACHVSVGSVTFKLVNSFVGLGF